MRFWLLVSKSKKIVLTANLCSGFGAASGSRFVVEAVGEESDDEENFGIFQKDRFDDIHDGNDIWTTNDRMSFAQDGEGYLDDDDLDLDNAAQDEIERDEGGGEIAWEYEIGPQGRAKFDEYYDARKAKNKKQRESQGRKDHL